MTVYAITGTKKGEQGLRLLIFKLPITPMAGGGALRHATGASLSS